MIAIRRIALAAAVAALAPAAARACEREQPKVVVRAPLPVPAVSWTVAAHWGDDGDRDDRRWRDGARHDGWRRHAPGYWAWRARERAELRAAYARLDEARERFHAAPHRPWRVREFEAWYARERAELDARWARLG